LHRKSAAATPRLPYSIFRESNPPRGDSNNPNRSKSLVAWE
jgi:hypothetical protein